ncbi:hypothetical protein AC579_10058 [Pseudocercospora musae]|uniref:Uncharacterized protein n=1 Tax=Pseudocercospora musae TaxID=113226 RepID=A0A139IGH8_9PEZI|nr:hypothetical protein AC579_10058 [Pseudocercospora musae]
MVTPTDAFISKLKSSIATLGSDKLNLEEDKANLQHQVAQLQNDLATSQRKLQIVAQASNTDAGKPVDYDKGVELEDKLAEDRAEFKDFIIAANDKVSKAEATTCHWKERAEEEQKFAARLKRQLDDVKDTMKALSLQKTQAEKKAKAATALAQEQTKEVHKAQKLKRDWEVKYKREVISRDVDAGKTTKFSFATPKAPVKPASESVNTVGKNKAVAFKPAITKAPSKNPGDPPSKKQPPSKGMSQLSIGKTEDAPLVLDEDEGDVPLAQRRAMTASKRKAGNMQNEEDQDDEEFLPIRIKRERIE